MTVHDGNGWTRCGLGHRHWGRHGAAGLLVAAPDRSGSPTVLLQQRSRWVSYAGTWSPPGGARDSHESIVAAALREAAEECGIDPDSVTVHGLLRDDHGGWAYGTVLANSSVPLRAVAISEETSKVGWVPVADVERLRLHPGFAGQWPVLRSALVPLTVIVDAANVMGSRPDGWWRDRAGAARRLVDEIAVLAPRGVADVSLLVSVPVLERWFPRFVVVLEGAAARDLGGPGAGGPGAGGPGVDGPGVDGPGVDGLRVVRARGSGDDEIIRQAADLAGPCLVVTADRELRARCEAVGAGVAGPRWLLDLL
jgi:8-oxo-dGTP pyrophosphatase MutT (NUDIX family)